MNEKIEEIYQSIKYVVDKRNFDDIIHCVKKHTHFSLIKVGLKHKDVAFIDAIISAGVSIRIGNDLLLRWTIAEQNLEMIKMLINKPGFDKYLMYRMIIGLDSNSPVHENIIWDNQIIKFGFDYLGFWDYIFSRRHELCHIVDRYGDKLKNFIHVMSVNGIDMIKYSKVIPYNACKYGSLNTLKFSIDIGVECDFDKLLDIALARTCVHISEFLIEKGARVTLVNVEFMNKLIGYCSDYEHRDYPDYDGLWKGTCKYALELLTLISKNGALISDYMITKTYNKTNSILIQYCDPNLYHLFHEDVLNEYRTYLPKSARN